jgi:uncharacterized Fe-S cluster protein YjdI
MVIEGTVEIPMFNYVIWHSTSAEGEKYGPRFKDQTEIQQCIMTIAECWCAYLKDFLHGTGKIFELPEFPWDKSERVIVSTLAGAISRCFKESLVLEELPVSKPSNPRIKKNTDRGRCDLWASIPELKVGNQQFSFYLEAKKAITAKTPLNADTYLKTDRGISRIFRDYLKSVSGDSGKIRTLSPYRNLENRKKLNHYVVGMLVMPLKLEMPDPDGEFPLVKIIEMFKDNFEGHAKLNGISEGGGAIRARRLKRHPTVALIVFPTNSNTGMIATFTVLAATRELLERQSA